MHTDNRGRVGDMLLAGLVSNGSYPWLTFPLGCILGIFSGVFLSLVFLSSGIPRFGWLRVLIYTEVWKTFLKFHFSIWSKFPALGPNACLCLLDLLNCGRLGVHNSISCRILFVKYYFTTYRALGYFKFIFLPLAGVY